MKKSLLFIPLISFAIGASAQTIVFEDNFDSVTAGMGVVEQNTSWNTWDGTAGLDGQVSSNYAFSGANSAKIEGTNVDLVLPIGPYTSGKYDLKFKMLVTDLGGYFNCLHKWTPTSTAYQWACDVYFSSTGAVSWTTGGTDSGVTGVTVNLLEWFDVMVSADMDADEGRLYINGTMVNQWQWSLNNANGAAGSNELDGADFYGTNDLQTAGLYYIDDVQVVESTGVYTEEAVTSAIPAFYPNPTSGNLNIMLPTDCKVAQLTITDLAGKVVVSQQLSSNLSLVDTSVLANGIYVVNIAANNMLLSEKLVVQ